MPDTAESFAPTDRSRVRRSHDRARYDKDAVFAVVDSAPLCHVGYAIDGQPYVTPTIHWRQGDRLYWHGSSASRMLRAVKGGIPVCVTVTHFDGWVMARSPFNHSANYRTAMLYGRAHALEDRDAKEASLKVMMDGLFPGRWEEVRGNTEQELKATTVVSMEIEDAVAKINSGPPTDDEADYGTVDCWAGVLPRREVWGPPEPDPRMDRPHPVPPYLKEPIYE
ncbi:MAG: pyridoxamine 5'-phosphate oxidase family protein [Alphaproteobacteria bacterium]|nr:pyridoxamine 5'-phosphate oxidase family protein [Alphaproteobacteria bacterium]